jgi:NADH-quinone oxidoreductase subunit J
MQGGTVAHFLYFFVFICTIVTAVLVIAPGLKTIYRTLALVATMLCLVVIFVLIQAPFVALIQLFVYAGAIMVLFLYVVMLVNPRLDEPIQLTFGGPGVALLLSAMFLLFSMSWILQIVRYSSEPVRFHTVSVHNLAAQLLGKYLLPFELTSVLLLVAIVGAILIARRQ